MIRIYWNTLDHPRRSLSGNIPDDIIHDCSKITAEHENLKNGSSAYRLEKRY